MPEESVAVRENGAVDLQILEDFDNSEWCTWQNRLLPVGRRIKEPRVLVHVENVFVREALDVFVESYELLDILVLSRRAGEDGVVYDDAVDGVVGVGFEDCFFNVFF